MEDGAYLGGDYAAKFKPGNAGPGVLLEMELTPLPRNGGKDRTACGSQSGVSVADDELYRMKAALDQRVKKGAPMSLGFTQGDAYAEDGALAVETDAHGDERGTGHKDATMPDLFVAGVDDEVGEGAKGPRGRSRQRRSSTSSLAAQALTLSPWVELT
jgi:hypothetical protein